MLRGRSGGPSSFLFILDGPASAPPRPVPAPYRPVRSAARALVEHAHQRDGALGLRERGLDLVRDLAAAFLPDRLQLPEGERALERLALRAFGLVEADPALDGVRDGVLENPMACRFDYASLACRDGDGSPWTGVPRTAETARVASGRPCRA